MNVNVIIGAEDASFGVVNISALSPTAFAITGVAAGPVRHASPEALDEIVLPSQAQTLVAKSVIDFYEPERVDTILDHWVTRLAIGGTITVGGTDLDQVARGIIDGKLDCKAANNLLYGKQKNPWEFRKAAYTLSLIADALKGRGLTILKKRHEDYQAFVLAERTI